MGIQIDEFKGIRARRETVARTSERWVLSSCLQQKTSTSAYFVQAVASYKSVESTVKARRLIAGS